MRKLFKLIYKMIHKREHYSEVLSMYRAEQGSTPNISYEQLYSIPFNKVLDVYPNVTQSVKGVRIKAKSNSLVFRLEIKKGAELLCHRHDDCKEVLLLLSGKMINLSTNKTVKKYRVMEIPPGQFHCLKALEDTVAYIEFTKT